jgi:hypothetical protein
MPTTTGAWAKDPSRLTETHEPVPSKQLGLSPLLDIRTSPHCGQAEIPASLPI